MSKKAMAEEWLIALILILIFLGIIIFFLLMKYTPGLSDYVQANIIGKLAGR